jgi:DNA repair exonuclease SbcCD ATPase subunit
VIPKRIVLENFLSFGSPETEIVFADDEPLWVLGGPNGVGKSAVFDAMTYALYGEHRGGATDHASLVRHGANGFRVKFEFEFNGAAYQIVRNRPLKGRPTQSMKQWANGGWTKSVQLPTGRQDQIKCWTERTLGIGFAAFKASVLLRQGEADAIITAGGAERLKILKKIIAVERYEQLAEKVHAQTRICKQRLEDLQTRRNGLTLIAEKDIQAVENELGQKEVERTRAHDARAEAVARVPLAKLFATLNAESKNLKQEIRDADSRARDAQRIREQHARLNDLTVALPLLRQLLKLRDDFLRADKTLAARQAEAKRLADAAIAKELRQELTREQAFLDAANGVKELEDKLSAFDPRLAHQVEAAREQLGLTAEALTETGKAKAATAGLLDQAIQKQQDFATLEVGVKCSLCGQHVTANHAKQERDRLGAEIKRLRDKVRECDKKELNDKKLRKAAEDECARLDKLARDQETLAKLLSAKQETLRGLGLTPKPAELRRQLAEKVAEVADLEKEVGDQSRADLPTLKARLGEVEAKVQADKTNIATMKAQQSALSEQLSANWHGRVAQLDSDALNFFDGEQQCLLATGVSDLLRKLEQDAAQRDGWTKRLDEVSRQIQEIPADSRVPVAEADEQLKAAILAATKADTARDAAKKKADDLATQADTFRKLVADIGGAETKAELHRKLDDLLGKCGLQRELVRTAEREIVRLANHTVQNLSDGELTIELQDGADGDDEAFALQVRRADGPTPIAVHYLSGSQKFRVAVAVALAIGRFAAGQARPLESVIIDEGFGSLDRDGLRCAAAELNRLRQHLRRIVLVSHQEEFADRFPVVIRLSRGENGTTAVAERK